jgi:hypothetical protein
MVFGLFVEIDLAGPARFALQFRDAAAKIGQDARFGLEVAGAFSVPVGNQAQITRRQDIGRLVGIGGPDIGQEIPANEPILEASAPPLAEVLFADGVAGEVPLQQLPHDREGIEPGEQSRAWLGAFQSDIDFFADPGWEPGDFTDAGFHSLVWDVILSS